MKMPEIKNPEYESVHAALENGKKRAERVYETQMMAAKQPAIAALHQGRITLEQYAELVGEAFAATMGEQYRSRVDAAAEEIRTRVDGGLLTQEEYEAIVGEAAK